MKSYSPYDNVAATEYPALFVTAGLNDPRVAYWEPAKFVAKLRATKTDDRLLVLKTEMGAGHGGPSGRYDAWRDEALVLAFLVDQLTGDAAMTEANSSLSPGTAALVTGGGSGIGLGCARRLLQRRRLGHDLRAHRGRDSSVRSPSCRPPSPAATVQYAVADVTDEDTIAAAVAQATASPPAAWTR